jgi:hypothetical protein
LLLDKSLVLFFNLSHISFPIDESPLIVVIHSIGRLRLAARKLKATLLRRPDDGTARNRAFCAASDEDPLVDHDLFERGKGRRLFCFLFDRRTSLGFWKSLVYKRKLVSLTSPIRLRERLLSI